MVSRRALFTFPLVSLVSSRATTATATPAPPEYAVWFELVNTTTFEHMVVPVSVTPGRASRLPVARLGRSNTTRCVMVSLMRRDEDTWVQLRVTAQSTTLVTVAKSTPAVSERGSLLIHLDLQPGSLPDLFITTVPWA